MNLGVSVVVSVACVMRSERRREYKLGCRQLPVGSNELEDFAIHCQLTTANSTVSLPCIPCNLWFEMRLFFTTEFTKGT